MTETLNRDELIALLNKMGSDDDEEALRAARQAHSQIAAAGVSWEDLLVPEEPDEESPEPDDQEDEEEEDGSPAEPAGTDAESLALIGELLARSDISAELRSELEGYKTDIAEGEFVAADRRYLRAVQQRLKK